MKYSGISQDKHRFIYNTSSIFTENSTKYIENYVIVTIVIILNNDTIIS